MSSTDSNQGNKSSRLRWIIVGLLGVAFLCACSFAAIFIFGPVIYGAVAVESESHEETSSSISEDQSNEGAEIDELEVSSPQGEESTPAPTSIPDPTATSPPTGLSRDDPAPIGTEVITKYQVQMVEEVIRPADDKIKQANFLNTHPDPGNEFVMILVTVQCIQPASEKCSISLIDYSLSGSTGLIREPKYIIMGIPNMLDSVEMFGGATLSGWLAFEVSQEETGLILAWEPLFSMSTAFFSLPEK